MLAHLSLQVLSQVLVLTYLHDDVELVAGLKRVVKVDDVFVVQLVHQKGLAQGLLFLLTTHSTEVNLLHNIDLAILFGDHLVNDTERALAKFLFKFELRQSISHISINKLLQIFN